MANKIIFNDDFPTNGAVDPTLWMINSVGPFIEPRSYFRQELPQASGGVVHLLMDTFDPNGNKVFISSDMVSTQKFDLSGGPLAFQAQVRYEQTQKGLIGGFFLYGGAPNTHDEIDFEAMSNFFGQIQTNVYHNEGPGDGHFQVHPLKAHPPTNDATLATFHTYRIEWYPDMVRWLVDGDVVREESNIVPTQAMNLHFNVWSGGPTWRTSDPSLNPEPSPGHTYTFDAKAVTVEQIPNHVANNAALIDSAASNQLLGTVDSEYLAGGVGDDTIIGGGGNDVIEGGAGANTAVYSGASRNFEVSIRTGEHVVNVADRSGLEGTDALHNIQFVHFADRTLDASSLDKAANTDGSQFIPLIDLYDGYLHRAPDAVGLAYWASQLGGMSLSDIAKSFFASAEAAALRPQGQSLTDMVSDAYTNILDRAADPGGLSYWVGELQSGHLALEKFALTFMQTAEASPGADAQILAYKLGVGAHYAIDQGLNDAAHAANVLAAFLGKSPTDGVEAALSLVESYAAAAALPDTSELVVKLIGVDVLPVAAG